MSVTLVNEIVFVKIFGSRQIIGIYYQWHFGNECVDCEVNLILESQFHYLQSQVMGEVAPVSNAQQLLRGIGNQIAVFRRPVVTLSRIKFSILHLCVSTLDCELLRYTHGFTQLIILVPSPTPPVPHRKTQSYIQRAAQ